MFENLGIATPTQIDTEICRLSQDAGQAAACLDRMHDLVGDSRGVVAHSRRGGNWKYSTVQTIELAGIHPRGAELLKEYERHSFAIEDVNYSAVNDRACGSNFPHWVGVRLRVAR